MLDFPHNSDKSFKMAGSSAAIIPKRGPGRPRGPSRQTQSLKDAIEGAFRDAGGREYLVRVAKRRPDVFLALVAKIIPQETRTTLLASYQAMPMPVTVEERNALPAPANAPQPGVLIVESVTVTSGGDADF